MAVTNNFAASTLDLNGEVSLSQPTALVWGPDGRLYITEVDGDVKVLTVAFGDKTPGDDDATAQFYVTDSTTVDLIKGAVQNHNDNGAENGGQNRQVTGIDVTAQYDDNGVLMTLADGTPMVTMYVTSSDSRIGAGGGGNDTNLDTNSGVITMMTQTGPDSWTAIDIVRGLPRSEENHATNGLEVIQEFDGAGNLISERIIVANGGNANSGAPSNNFAGQQEQPLSGAILEIDLTMLKSMQVLDDDGRAYIYDAPTLNDPSRTDGVDGDTNDPFGGNDGRNSAKLLDDGPISIYSPGYRNAYDVEVTDDGRVWTYDNGANNSWGGRPIGEAGDNNTFDNPQDPGYIATNLNNGEGNSNDDINLENWNPSNKDNFHEVTRSDDLNGGSLSVGGNGAVTTYTGPDGLTYVYGGHPNPTRAEGSMAGLLFSPDAGTDNAFLLVSVNDTYNDDGDNNPLTNSDYDQVIEWLEAVEANNADFPSSGIYGAGDGDLTKKVLAVTPGVLYDIYSFADGSGQAVVAGGAAPSGGTLQGQAGLPEDIAEIVAYRNTVEGDYKEAGKTDGTLDSGNGSINGLAEYTSTILDDAGTTMSGAILATQLGGGNIIVMGRNEDGSMTSTTSGGFAVAADRTVIGASGGPLGISTVGDDYLERGLSQPFQGSIWTAVYNGQGAPSIEIFQPNNGAVPLAGAEIVNPTDRDLDGVDYISDPFDLSEDNGYAIAPGEKIVLDFNPQNTNFTISINGTGLLGAALDGETPNRDAQTEAENFPVDQQFDGLYNIGENVLPGGNAPILQIKNVVEGTVVGDANSARDVLHTGILPSADTDRIVATMNVKNWIPATSGVATGQLTGMIFGDGTQANFVRLVFGAVDVGGGPVPGIEVGFEIGDENYTVLERIALPALSSATVSQLDLRLTIDKEAGFAVTAEYRLEGQTTFTALDLGGFVLPENSVLREVLTGDHTIGEGAAEATSGAAFGFLAETSPGNVLETIDFNELSIEAFGNEIEATTAAQVGGAGSANVDTVIYTGTETALAPLAADVENFDGTGSGADYAVTGNALDNVIRVGTGANIVTTGTGKDEVRGTLAQLAGDEITDFSGEDKVVIEGASLIGLDVDYGVGSAVVLVNGQAITFSGEDFANFEAADGPSTFNFTQGPDGLEITLIPDEAVIYRINAGDTVGAIDGGLDWIGDNGLNATPTNGVAKIGGKGSTYSNAITDAEDEVDYDNVDAAIVPWQVFVDERGQGIPNAAAVEYTFAVQVGVSYKIEYFYTENWPGIYTSEQRVFDVQVEGDVPEAFEDIHPLREATDFVDGATVPLPTSDANAQDYNGVARKAEYIYTAEDDTLNIALVNNTQEAKVNAIQITQLGGTFVPPADATAPVIASISLENPQSVQDGVREATIVLTDETAFDVAAFTGLDGSELTVTGVALSDTTFGGVALSNGNKTATLTYVLTAEGGDWPNGSVGEISVAADTFADAAGNGNAAASGGFVINALLGQLERGLVVRAINVGTTDQAPGTLAADPFEGGAADNDRYGGAIEADTIITDAFGDPIAFEADSNAYYTSPKTNGQLNANVDGQSTQQGSGSNAGGVDLDGSAYHTYRDSNAATWTGTYDGFDNGTYIVELHFAELFWNAAGGRVGDFTVNGVLIDDLDDLDVFAEAGNDDTPYFVRVPVTVTDGTITVEVSSSAGQAGYSAIVVYEAVNPSAPPSLSIGDVTVAEGDLAEITILRSGNLADATSVDVALAFDGAADAADVGVLSAGTVTFAAGEFSKTITLPITDDTDEEGAETLSVILSNPSGAATLANDTAIVTIAASDSDLQAPVGTTIFELDFENASGEPLDVGGFDGALGTNNAVTIVDADAEITGGKLVVQTSEGDINDGTDNASNNDFTKSVDLSDPTLTEIFLTTRFDNPFDAAFFTAQGLADGLVPNFAQQGIVLGTGTQLAGEMVKLVWGGVAGNPDVLGVQMWTKGSGQPAVAASLAQMAGPSVGSTDVASLELTLMIDKVNGLSGQYVTLFDDLGNVLGGTRPTETPGFFTVAPLATPAAVLANITSNAAPTHVGVHSTDNSDADGTPLGVESFEASWDFLRLSSPQFDDTPVPDTDGPTATVTLAAPDSDSDPIVATVVYADASDIDGASVDATDLTLSGPSTAGAITLTSFDEATNTAVYSIAAPAGGWADGAYTATVAASEVSDQADTPNFNVGGETADVTLSFEDEPVADFERGDVRLAINAGGGVVDGAAYGLGDADFEADTAGAPHPTVDTSAGTTGDAGNNTNDNAAAETFTGLDLPDDVFTSERWGDALSYDVDLPDGTYIVDLYFAETYQGVAEEVGGDNIGDRLFDVDIEGEKVLDDYDLFDDGDGVLGNDAGAPLVKIVKTFTATVTGGQLNIAFDATGPDSADNAKISALVVYDAVPVSTDILVSLTGPGAVVENADDTAQGDDQDLTFTLTASDPAFSGTLDLTLDVDGVTTPLTGVAFTDGVATYSVPVSTDTRWNDSESVPVTLLSVETSGYAVDTAAASATATLTEDDPADSHDLDGAGGADPVVVGDFSDDRLAPSDIGAMQIGENILFATQQGDSAPGGRDRDYITFEVPEGAVMTQLILDGYDTDEITAQAFLAIQAGTAVTVDPTDGTSDDPENPEGPFGGLIYGGGLINNDLLGQLLAGDDDVQDGVGFPGLDSDVLPAGTYTLWLNQGGTSTQVTLRAVLEAAPSDDIGLSIADAPTLLEAGDTGTTDLVFALTATDATLSGPVEVFYDTDTQNGLNQIVTFTAGTATLTVSVPNDDVATDDTIVTVTLTDAVNDGADSFVISDTAGAATGTITEDDLPPIIEKGDVVFAVNAGGLEVTDTNGVTYEASNGFTGVNGTFGGANSIDYTGDGVDDADDAVYETEVYGGEDADPDLVFTRGGLTPGDYLLTLKFAEIFATAQGARVFDVSVNGAPMTIDDLDLVAVAGPDTAYDVDLPITIGNDGILTIALDPSVDNAKISALALFEKIEIDPTAVAVAVSDLTVSEEAGTAEVVFTRTGNTDTDMVITYSTADGSATAGADYAAATAQTVTILAGDTSATASIALTGDSEDEGDETFSVTIDSAVATGATVTVDTPTATVTLTDDEAVDPADIDGDGILNIDDPFAYDGTNGDAKMLAVNGSFRQDFNVDTTDPFSAEAGFSGIMVNPAFTPGGDLTTDPYGDRTSEATTLVEDGVFKTQSSIQDSFANAGDVSNSNTLKDNYQSAVDVSGVESFSIEGKANNVFAEVFAGGIPTQYASYGISLGAGGVDDFVKLVVGGIGNSPTAKELRVEIGHNNSLVGAATAVTLVSAGIDKATQATIASVVFRVEVDVSAPTTTSAGTLTGVVTFLDAAGEEIGTITTVARDIDPGGSLAAAIAGENPLTGGDGGLAYGVSITHYNNAANQFTGEWDYLEIANTTLNEAPTVAVEIADQTPPEDALYSFAIPAGTFADDAGEGALTLTASLADDTDLPSWLTFDGTTFSGTPLQADVDAGPITVKVTATDAQGESVSDEFTLTPLNVNDAPTITGTLDAVETTVGAATTVDLSALTLADEDGDTPTLVALSQGGTPLPAGIALVGTSLEVADTTAEGVYVIDVFANDAQVNSDTPVSVTVTVGAPLNEAPTVAAEILDQTPAEDALYSFAIPAGTFADDAGEGALTLTASLADDTDLPSWLTFDGTTFSGTPLQADVDAGPITVKVTATDAQGESVSDEFTLTPLNVNDAPTITGTLDAVETTVGAATTVDLSALTLTDEDGDTPTLVALSQGGTPLPAGIALVGTSLEVADTTAEGVYVIDVFANDAQVNSDTPVSVTVTVGAPVVTGDPIRIQAEDFTSATGYAVQSQSAAEGGEVIFLPQNGGAGSAAFDLAAKGVIAGTYNVTLRYFDENDGVSTINLAVDSTPIGSITLNDPNGGNAAQAASARTMTFTNVVVGENGSLVIDGVTGGGEYARIDWIEFTPVDNTGGSDNTAPFAPFDLPDAQLDENETFSFNAGLLFADVEEDALTFTATTNTADGVLNGLLPTGVSFANGVFSGAPTTAGTYEITVIANDGEFDSAPEIFTLTVDGVNEAPVVDQAIADQTVAQGAAVTLDVTGAFSDPDGDALMYSVDEASLPDGVTFANGVFSGTPSTTASGSYQVTVTAEDPDGAMVSDTFLFNVTGGVDTRPTVRIEAEDGTLVDGFFVEAGSRIRLLAGDSGEATYDLSGIAPGEYLVKIAHYDENDGESTIGVAIASNDQAPFSDSFVLDDDATSSNAATAASFRIKTLPGTVTLSANGQLTLTGQSAGNGSDFEFVRIDWIELVPVGGGSANFAPTEAGGGIPDAIVQGLGAIALDASGAFSDPEEDTLTYAKVSGPDWILVDPASGAITGTPPAGGNYEIAVSAEDAANNPGVLATSGFVLTVQVPDNLPPTLDASVGSVVVAQDGFVEEAVTFSDPEGGAVIYELGADAPAWLMIDSDGTLSGTPGAGDVAANLQVEVIATDALGASASTIVDITVTNVNDAPVTGTPLVNQEAVVDEVFAYALPVDAFIDADDYLGDTLTYSAKLANGDDLPGWLSINLTTGELSGTPDSDADLSVVITATDSAGAFVSAAPLAIDVTTFTVPLEPVTIQAEDFTGLGSATNFAVNNLSSASDGQVIRMPANVDGVITTDLSAFAGASYTVRVTYIDETDGASTARVLVGGVELGAWSFDGASGTQVTPGGATGTLGQPGNYRFIDLPVPFGIVDGSTLTLEMTSQGGEFGRVDFIELIPAALPPANQVPTVLAGIADQTPAEDAVYSFTVPAGTFADDAGEAGLTLTATLADDSPLPDWLDFDGTAFSGTPLQADVNEGPIAVKVTATDAGGLAVSDEFTLTPQNVNDAPTIDGTLAPVGTTVGAATSVDLSGLALADEDGTVPTLVAEIQGGNPLPAGITLDGATINVADTTAEGVYTIDVFANDGELDSATPVSVTVTVGTAPSDDGFAPDGDLDGDGVPNAVDPDVDGDDVANADDPFAYDAGNGMTLAAGETKSFDFDTDGTIFQNGLTGFLQGTTNGGVFNEDTGANSVSGGLLTVNPVTGGDTGGTNNPQDDAVVGVKNGTFVVKAVVLNPWVGAAANPGGFDQLGLVMGLDSADMIKLVFGQTGQQVEFQKQQADVATKFGGSTGGGNSNFNLSTIGQSLDSFAKAEITFEVVSTNAATASVTGTIVFLADDGTVLATQGMGTAPVGGALAAALADPAKGVAVGFTHADAAAAPGFIAQLDSLTITEGDGSVPSVDTDAPTAAITLTNPVDATAPLLVSVALDDASGIDTGTLGDADLALSVGGFAVLDPDVTYLGFADGVASYEIAASAAGWLDGQQIEVTLLAGEVADLATAGNTNAATGQALTLDIGGGSTGGGEDEVVFRINAGGNFVAATDGGPDWVADSIASPNVYLTVSDNRNDTGGNAVSTFDGVPSALFAEARSSDFAFSYDIPTSVLENGENYEVRLYFAEIFSGAQGGDFRNFDATVEGFVPAAFNNIDPGALFGGNAGVLTTQVKVTDGTLNIGFTQDVAQNPIISAIEIVKLSTDVENPEPPVNPGNALEAFAAQDDIVKDATYGAGATGSAVLEIMTGDNNIQSSNYGADSFEVTNTGDKKISAIFIDVSSALYQDSVFDPDGLGGDNVAKPWQINGAGNTGAFISGNGYFLPGVDPIPNSGGSGGASNGGFKGAMVKFNANSSGGFELGETVGFSGDMDPNSIAGMTKASVDGTAILSWDVGGISGHELIGSLFTVLFDDGTTASGQLASDGSSAGSHALATQGAAPAAAPGIAVNGFQPGQNGTYGGTLPTITVTGNPGDKVQITMTKGFNPVVETSNGIADVVEDRLARYDFKANNAFDAQTKIVTIGADGTFDASTLFDYDDAINNNVGSGSFTGDDVAQIGFVATKVQSGGAQLPIGPTTAPIYLTSNGTPVTGDPTGGTGGGADGYFQIVGSGAAAYFKMEIEDARIANGGEDPGGKWNFVDATDEAGRQNGFTGDGYYVYGSNASSAINGVISGEVLEYTILVPEGQTGNFNFQFRVSRDGTAAGDQQNDLWLNFKEAGKSGAGDIEDYLTDTANEAEPLSNGYIKIFGGPNNGSWGTASAYDGLPGNPTAQIAITEPGLYTIQIAGRSQGFHVDSFWLAKTGGSTPNAGSANSAFVSTGPAAPEISGTANAATVADGATLAFDVDATDLNGDTLSYGITGGADADLFEIDASTGVVSFKDPANFTAPADAGGNNVYDLQVTVSDPGGLTDARDYAVTVTDDLTPTILRVAVATGSDDTDQNANAGTVNLTKADMELGDGGRDIGLRFTDLDLESLEGVNILDAYIEFTARSGSSGAINATVKLQDSLNPATFSAASGPTDRDTFDFTAVWTDSSVPAAGSKFRTDDLSDLIEAFVASRNAELGSDDDLAFVIEDVSGVRKALSFEGGAASELVLIFQDDNILG